MNSFIIDLAEKGIVPDFIIRYGIRRLCQKRLYRAKSIGSERVEVEHQEWVEKLLKSPIALVPEKANEQHYELPPQFFEQVLGKYLKYSSGYWLNSKTLNDSEKEMLEITYNRSEIVDSMNILELGCGWGSFTLFMAQRLPNSNITAVSNSNDQREYIQNKCKKMGYSNVTVITADMNDFDTKNKFDRVVSIEMFEHMRNYGKLLKKISNWLNEDGKLFVHIFSHKNLVYPFENNGPDDWMGREFFSGGLMPSRRLLLHFQDHMIIQKMWYMSGEYYSKTANAWLYRMDQNKLKIMELFSETYGKSNAKMWIQRWRIFFMSCAELFGMNNGSEYGITHYLFTKKK